MSAAVCSGTNLTQFLEVGQASLAGCATASTPPCAGYDAFYLRNILETVIDPSGSGYVFCDFKARAIEGGRAAQIERASLL